MGSIQGTVVVEETGKGLRGLLVTSYDVNYDAYASASRAESESEAGQSPWLRSCADRIGSVVTDDCGAFQILYADDVIRGHKSGRRPNLALVIATPPECGCGNNNPSLEIYCGVRWNAGTVETFIIRVPGKHLSPSYTTRAGQFINCCRIDLPPDDVIEEIEFERFFLLNLKYGDLLPVLNLQDVTNPSLRLTGPSGLKTQGITTAVGHKAEAAAPEEGSQGADRRHKDPVRQTVPLSTNPDDWAHALRGVTPEFTEALAKYGLAGAGARAGALDPEVPDIKSFQLAIYMPFTQKWKLDGYTRGRLVNSFSLGPGEEQTVDLFTWDRTRTSLETSTSFEEEQTTESSGTRRDTSDVSWELSRQAGLEMTTNGKVGFQVGVVNADLSAGISARASVNEAEKTTRSSVVEATNRSTNRVRTSRTLKATEAREFGREERVTRRLRNPNACHTLTVTFFEILANYHLTTSVSTAGMRLVVLIPGSQLVSLTGFDRKTVRAHETSLRLALLDRALLPGFDAARLLDARDRACTILCKGCSCGDVPTGNIPGPEWEAAVAAARDVANKSTMLLTEPVLYPASLLGAALLPDPIPGTVADIQRHVFKEALRTHAPRLAAEIATIGIGGGNAPVSERQVEALARITTAVPADALALLRKDPSVSTEVYNDAYNRLVIPLGPLDHVSALVAREVIKSRQAFDKYNDAGLVDALSSFGVAYDAWAKVKQAEQQKNEKLAELARIAKEERELRILETFGFRESADAEERLEALLDHLNDRRNFDHYRFAVWNERCGRPNEIVMSLALAGWIEPTPVGMVGDSLAVPVRLEGRFASFFTECIADLVKNTPVDEKRHILPTAALYAESIVGECCACEDEIVERRLLETERMRIDNQLLELERRRLEKRLEAKPPLLKKDPPAPARLELIVRRADSGDREEAMSSGSSSGGAPGERIGRV